MPFQPTDELSIRLTVNEWNQVIGALQEEKQRIANPIINKINMQAQEHEQAELKARQELPPIGPVQNGELHGDINPMPPAPRPPGWTEGEHQ